MSEADRIRAAYAKRPIADPRYSWFHPGHVFLAQRREQETLAMLARHGITDLGTLRILEVGCGDGHWLRELVKWGADPRRIVGVDVVRDRLHAARRRSAPGIALLGASGEALPFPDATFDLVIQSTVFSSILSPAIRQQVAREMVRVLCPGARILWYDFYVDNPANSDVRRVGRADIGRLFPACAVELRRVTLAPPVARRLAGRGRIACLLLEKVPLLRTHFLGVLTKHG